MSNTRFFNPRRNRAWSGIGIDRAAARSNAMHFSSTRGAMAPGAGSASIAPRLEATQCIGAAAWFSYGVI
jgi:hypothetical protein